MQSGLLWFDNDPQRGLTNKIEDAVRRYQEKYGRSPNTCYVNSALFNRGVATDAPPTNSQLALRIVPKANILPHHFWVGEEGE